MVAKDVVGLTKYERLIYIKKNEWHEELLAGEDPTWGKMSIYRMGIDIDSTESQDDIEVRKAA
ncbi:hypothetical protein D3C84_1107610 [compost metagenome]